MSGSLFARGCSPGLVIVASAAMAAPQSDGLPVPAAPEVVQPLNVPSSKPPLTSGPLIVAQALVRDGRDESRLLRIPLAVVEVTFSGTMVSRALMPGATK